MNWNDIQVQIFHFGFDHHQNSDSKRQNPQFDQRNHLHQEQNNRFWLLRHAAIHLDSNLFESNQTQYNNQKLGLNLIHIPWQYKRELTQNQKQSQNYFYM